VDDAARQQADRQRQEPGDGQRAADDRQAEPRRRQAEYCGGPPRARRAPRHMTRGAAGTPRAPAESSAMAATNFRWRSAAAYVALIAASGPCLVDLVERRAGDAAERREPALRDALPDRTLPRLRAERVRPALRDGVRDAEERAE